MVSLRAVNTTIVLGGETESPRRWSSGVGPLARLSDPESPMQNWWQSANTLNRQRFGPGSGACHHLANFRIAVVLECLEHRNVRLVANFAKQTQGLPPYR